MKFRKKPVVIDAVQWTGSNVQELMEWFGQFDGHIAPMNDEERCGQCVAHFNARQVPIALTIPTLEGEHVASPGDWIIRGVKGEYYPCKPDIFEMTYEPVDGGGQ